MIYRKLKDESVSARLFFGAAAITLTALYFISKTGNYLAITIACFAIVAGCMHAVNLILVCFLPKRLAKHGRISMISGLLNFATYAGSALSIYGFAALSQRIGWSGTVAAWTVISLLGAAFCFFMYKPLKRHSLSKNNDFQQK